jgi:transcription factor TFIIIB component B''
MLMSDIIAGALKSVSKRKRTDKLDETSAITLAAVEDLLDGLIPTAPSTPSTTKPSSAEPGNFEFDSEGNIVYSSANPTSTSVDFGSAVATEITGYEHAYKRTAPVKWTPAMDLRFYQGLSRFGSDLSLVGSLFPGISDAHIRSKFKKEDKRNPDKVADALHQSKRRRTIDRPVLEEQLPSLAPASAEAVSQIEAAAEEDLLDLEKLLDI